MSELVFLVLGICLTLANVFINTSIDDIGKAVELCNNNDGVKTLVSRTLRNNAVSCKNGARFEIKDSK